MAHYLDIDQTNFAATTEARILVRVALDSITDTVLAVMDTAAPWCIFEPRVRLALERTLEPVIARTALSTRLGVFHGSLYRIPVRLAADEGESLSLEATVFLSPDWRGPNFIGYQGLLQRIRFAVDPETNLFYFGQI
jgi:hypothetical protein